MRADGVTESFVSLYNRYRFRQVGVSKSALKPSRKTLCGSLRDDIVTIKI